ncbi:MAG TPA: LysR family transcriptional regulator [Xanthobacteraceae bacterium]|jgi:DNA-binding transcriptional LysR family regulator|nr:LysR family transcriptional regulator [Xanthobacteraceae bacterium]
MSEFDERSLNGMSIFAKVVDAGSFAAAGEQLDMSQPGVSRAISRLEARLGFRLFDRTPRAALLTDDGRRFYEQIAPLLAGLREAAATASGNANSVRGRLRVNVDPFFSKLLLGPRLEAFMNRYPDLTVELITRDRLGDKVIDGLDLAVHFGEPRISTMRARKLLETRIVTVASPAYVERHGRPLRPEDLGQGGHVCIESRHTWTGRPSKWEFHRGSQQMHVETSGNLIIDDSATVLNACMAGHGIAQIMEFGAEKFLAEGKLIDLFPEWPDKRFPLYALYLSGSHPPARTRAFLDFLVSLMERISHAPSRGIERMARGAALPER